ncbi:MAG: hypothetical protein SOV74_07565 [Coriobacteriales bacterium]|nr:hypothetical protein [Coriobacteriales bacterium]
MADENEPEEKGEEPAEPETDWKAEARKWERRSKENAEKAKAYDELQEQSKTELQKAREQAAAYKRQVDDLNAKAEADAARAKVARDTGVPAELIAGDDEDSMRQFAEAVAKWGKPSSAPRTRRPGSFANDAGESKDAAKRELARRIFGSDQ